ncbi:stem-specific protein TSJT1-like isoform X2 [Brassica napus]|uniref:stem-specific protein TSJT1-like isoform X2 n=1 Tax=Brassica napus TaxID=3708 RepID=UPI00207A1FEC|nr:stem-specific protein TSJT1-like isoform X2 [Brassica napus]
MILLRLNKKLDHPGSLKQQYELTEATNRVSFGAKDEIFCLFQGSLDNLGSLKQQYGLAKNANEVLLVIEAYKTLRDRAPYPANHVVSHLSGDFAFVVFDKSTSALFVAYVSSF